MCRTMGLNDFMTLRMAKCTWPTNRVPHGRVGMTTSMRSSLEPEPKSKMHKRMVNNQLKEIRIFWNNHNIYKISHQ